MGEHSGARWLSYSAAAKRVKSSPRTIKRWRREGMPMGWRTGSGGQRERVVDEKVLLAWFRQKLQASPVHYYRMRQRAQGFPDPIRPVRAPSPGAEVPRENLDASQRSDENRPTPAPVVDPLADMKPLRGGPEYRALVDAFKEAEPGCRDIDAFTADKIDPEEEPILAAICAACPVIELCAAFVRVQEPEVGFWAGRRASAVETAA